MKLSKLIPILLAILPLLLELIKKLEEIFDPDDKHVAIT